MLPNPTSRASDRAGAAARGRCREVPGAGARRARKRDDAPRAGEQQRHRVIGDLVEAEVRDVHDEDPELGRALDRDVVDADAVARDDDAARRGVERLGGHALPVRQDRVDARGEADQLIGSPGLGDDSSAPASARIPRSMSSDGQAVVGHEHRVADQCLLRLPAAGTPLGLELRHDLGSPPRRRVPGRSRSLRPLARAQGTRRCR